MRNVVIYETQATSPAALGLKTDILVDTGTTLCFRQRDTYGDVYYIGDGMLVIAETPACGKGVKNFVVKNGERSFLIESLDTPVVVAEEKFLDYLRGLTEKVEVWTAYGLWYLARFIFTDPSERKVFEEFMTKEPYSKYYVWYYYSAYVDKDMLLEIVDKIRRKQ
jgi:hypothetical protein